MIRDVVVIGAGLAGTVIAHAFSKEMDTLLLGESQPSVPIGIAHPFAGRAVKPDPLMYESYWNSVQTLRVMDRNSRWHKEVWVKRLVQPDDRLSQSFVRLQDELPAWLDAELKGDELIYQPGLVVAVDEVIGLIQSQLHHVNASVASVLRCDEHWELRGPEGIWRAQRVVLALGAQSPDWLLSEQWDVTLGELAYLKGEGPADILIGTGAHVSPALKGHYGAGSTYERPGSDPLVLRAQLMEKVHGLWPAVQDDQVQWYRGTRCVHKSTRKPVVGEIEKGLFVALGFGSKGMAWVPWAAAALVGNVVRGADLPAELGPDQRDFRLSGRIQL